MSLFACKRNFLDEQYQLNWQITHFYCKKKRGRALSIRLIQNSCSPEEKMLLFYNFVVRIANYLMRD
jgi:hypothetical protein